MILDNMGRQKAIAALEIYREHEKFRKSLEAIQEESLIPEGDSKPAQIEEPVDDGFLEQVINKPKEIFEEERKEPIAKRVNKRVSSHKVAAQQS